MLESSNIALPGESLPKEVVIEAIQGTVANRFRNQRVLVLIPDHTRSIPLPFLFRALVKILPNTRQLDFMVALGTHPALSRAKLYELVGITEEESADRYQHIGLLNHDWANPDALTSIGSIDQDQIRLLAGPIWHESLPDRVDIRINKCIHDYDHILIVGPTFPHEVVGFSGGAKYLFPGISGPDMINATHWLGALAGVMNTIGMRDTPVREMIHMAARSVKTPITLMAAVIEDHQISGLFIGDLISAWQAAADLSAQRHIRWCEKPYKQVLSCPPVMYDELWTAAKAMYKLESVVAQGGELIIYAPHLDVVSHVHGKYIYEVGYHILLYFLRNWDCFKHIPLGVLAHSTHVRGSGRMVEDMEYPNVNVTLASKIPPEDCKKLNLGYMDPSKIKISEWQDREDEGILYVPSAGEILYKMR